MVQAAEGTVYKSRPKLLVRFFEKSRDGWKSKCREAKAELKKARNLICWLETSRDDWKARAK